MEYPLAASRTASVNPSKASTVRKRTRSPVLLLFPGSFTVITEEPEFPEVRALKGNRTATAGSVLSGRASRKASGSAATLETDSCGCLASHSSFPTRRPVHSFCILRRGYAAPLLSEIPRAYLLEANLAINQSHLGRDRTEQQMYLSCLYLPMRPAQILPHREPSKSVLFEGRVLGLDNRPDPQPNRGRI